ncbi:MAG TPA: MerR family transcriptional regulator [Oxalicibacterium sp.]|nr:MerR family transcriptional regulator [Oxalicibacterium sp.]
MARSATKHDLPSAPLIPIRDVEKQTGIAQATLRMWEKRYGFPLPSRDRHGDRVYTLQQVERLRLVRQLIDQGKRPGKILADDAFLQSLSGTPQRRQAEAMPAAHAAAILLLSRCCFAELRGRLQYQLLDLGLRRFVLEVMGPLTAAVTQARQHGQLPAWAEHAYTELAASLLHQSLSTVQAHAQTPKVVLAALSGEANGMRLLMVEALLVAQQAKCIQLGVGLSIAELAAAVAALRPDIVAMSFSAFHPRMRLVQRLSSLRAALPYTPAIWIGGANSATAGALPNELADIVSLSGIDATLRAWRERHA